MGGVNVLQEGPRTIGTDILGNAILNNDEGRAMAQIVFDVAPGASIDFYAPWTSKDFASGVDALVADGCDVIVDDLSFYDEPMFQDSFGSRAIDRATAAGVVVLSSAGNGARLAYDGVFRGSGRTVLGGYAHDFDAGAGVDIAQNVTIPQNGRFFITLQWDQPFATLAGGSGASTDLDVYLADRDGNVVAQSSNANVGADPVEYLDWTNGSTDPQYFLYVVRKSGPVPTRLKWTTSTAGAGVSAEYTGNPTLWGHQTASSVIAVAAADEHGVTTDIFDRTPAPSVEWFSSAGPATILFDNAGARLATPIVRDTVRITGPDGANTSVAAMGADTDGDLVPNFYGSSAAAPHVAGLAALMLQAYPNLKSQQFRDAIESTAIDMDDPGTFGWDPGQDARTGAGFLQAEKAFLVPDAAPTLQVFAASTMVIRPDVVRLTALNVADADDGRVIGVSFYVESNGSTGLQTGPGGDMFISTDAAGFDGYTAARWTGDLYTGRTLFYAAAMDGRGKLGVASVYVDIQGHNPVITSLVPNFSMVVAGQPLTITAQGVFASDAPVSDVSFYVESDGTPGLLPEQSPLRPGLPPRGDRLIGTDYDAAGGWSITLPNVGAGTYTIYVQATDALAQKSATGTAAVSVTVVVLPA